jgi:hypothetical protein
LSTYKREERLKLYPIALKENGVLTSLKEALSKWMNKYPDELDEYSKQLKNPPPKLQLKPGSVKREDDPARKRIQEKIEEYRKKKEIEDLEKAQRQKLLAKDAKTLHWLIVDFRLPVRFLPKIFEKYGYARVHLLHPDDVVQKLMSEIPKFLSNSNDYVDILVVSNKLRELPLEPFKLFHVKKMSYNMSDREPYRFGFCFLDTFQIPITFIHVDSATEFNPDDYYLRIDNFHKFVSYEEKKVRNSEISHKIHPSARNVGGVHELVVEAMRRWEDNYPDEWDPRVKAKYQNSK